MTKFPLIASPVVFMAALIAASNVQAQEAVEPPPALGPSDYVKGAEMGEWVAIAPSDLLVMDIAPDAKGDARRVVIQLMPPPFSQGWIGNIRKLAAAKFWDGTSINRVQDNYVVQWGDAGYDNPESGEVEQKALPEGLVEVPENQYSENYNPTMFKFRWSMSGRTEAVKSVRPQAHGTATYVQPSNYMDAYAEHVSFIETFPVAMKTEQMKGTPKDELLFGPSEVWPVHCYGMVGVGRNLSPNTGSGAELYTVIGHAPRHLDRNIAVVGRIIEGIEHLSSLPRGKGQLGFYADASKRVPIQSIRLGNALPAADQPQFEYLDTASKAFARYADARANRRDPFFIKPAGGADICNIPVPVRRVKVEE